MKKQRALVTLIAVIAIFFQCLPLHACSFDTRPYFTYDCHPDLPLKKYAAGQLGILQPNFARSYLLVAYRYLSNEPLSPEEQKRAIDLWNTRLTSNEMNCSTDASAWLKARTTVPGTKPIETITTERAISAEESWQTFCNCRTNSFVTAAKTLSSLGAKFGLDSAATKEWLKAQDEVFSNCGSAQYGTVPKADIPQPLPANSDRALQKERDYQIAAANFYAQNFSVARKLFQSIAEDTDSPWRQIAAYLAVRSTIREATLGKTMNTGLLAEAQKALEQLSADSVNKNMQEDYRLLINFVMARLQPENYLQKQVQEIKPLNDIGEITASIDALLDKNQLSQDAGQCEYAKLPDALKKPDIVDWVMTFQSTGEAAKKHALERWKATNSTRWLVAAIQATDADDEDAGALISAAEHQLSGPAKWTLFYYVNRLGIDRGKIDACRVQLDKVLDNPPADLPAGSLNQLRAMRLELARNLDEFVRFGVQRPLAICTNALVSEVPDGIDDIVKTGKVPDSPSPEFIPTAGEVLNNQLPLSVLKQLSSNPKLPADLRNNVAWTSWVRAVLIGDDAAAHDLALIAKPLNKKRSQLFDSYLSSSTPEARKFAAVFLMLHFSSANPNATWGPLASDGYGDDSGWWWGAKPVAGTIQMGMGDADSNNVKPIKPLFLTAAQRQEAKAQLARLEKVETAPNYFAKVVLPYAKAHPDDPRVPEALNFLVKSTRYGNTDDTTKGFSKQAFTVLHTRYKTNPWTKKTPYFY
jgi:hypothetical protein